MLPVEDGRFCSSCAKSVVDFTRMSDHQIVRYMSASKASVCARITMHQLDREFTVYQQEQVRSFNLQALVLGTALSAFTALNVYGQEPGKESVPSTSPVEKTIKTGKIAVMPQKPLTDTVFSGTVIDSVKRLSIKAVEVTSYDEAGTPLVITSSNGSGYFELPLHEAEHPYRIVFHRSGYEEASCLVAELSAMRNVTVELVQSEVIIMGRFMPR